MNQFQSYYRDTWAEVDLDNIRYNITNIKRLLPNDVQVLAAVKADGYGHGAVEVAKAALEAGASYLGVATLDEALAIRNAEINCPILVMGYVPPKYAFLALQGNVTLTVFQSSWMEEVASLLGKNANKLTCHVKIDTGMGRLGIRTKEEGNALIGTLKKYSIFQVEGMYTHFATADERDTSYFERQYKRFEMMTSYLEDQLGQEVTIKHCGNSATALRFYEKCFNMVRVGIAMYGLSPSEEMKQTLPFPLREAFSLHSKVTHIKQVPKGEGISYGATYETTDNEWIATIPIGYADGWIRANNVGEVLINGKRASIVGRICMDQMMVSLNEPVKLGTKVTLIGRQGNEYISVDDIGQRLNTINYEIPCMISYRVPRIVIEGGQVVTIKNKVLY